MKILFLCTGNAARSQMAEGWARHLKGDAITPHSAGLETHGLHPLAVQVMAEAGVDISGHRSKLVAELTDLEFDRVVTVCDKAARNCPRFPDTTRVVLQEFPDPVNMASWAETEEEALGCFRRVRDQIRDYVATLPEALEGK